MKRVYICAPLSGNILQNIFNAIQFGKYVIKECDAAPLVPHIYALMLDDNIPKEREKGMLADFSLIWMIDELWVFGNTITMGMNEEIQRAKTLKIPIKRISNRKVNEILMKYGGKFYNDKVF